MKISFNLSDELVKEIDEKAGNLFISRTACIAMLLSQSLQNEKAISSLDSLVGELKTLKNIDIKKEE